VHPNSRWLWMMADLLQGVPNGESGLSPTVTTAGNGEVTIRVTATGSGTRTFALRSENLVVSQPVKTVSLRTGAPTTIEWKGRLVRSDGEWIGVVVPDGDITRRVEIARGGSLRR
jgi:hypothetical protein